MKFYYIDTIEQVKATDDFPYNINEYGARAKYAESWESVLSKFYKKLSDVSADLIGGEKEDAKHYYMDIRIVDNSGEVLKNDQVGTAQEVEKKKPEPTPEPENTEG